VIDDWFQSDYYKWTRERNYRGLVPKVIVEPYIFGKEGVEDFKIICIHSTPNVIWVDIGRHSDHRRNLYDTDWNLLDAQYGHLNGPEVPKPANLERMLQIAQKLSIGHSFLRVDLYTDGKQILVGELTSFPTNAVDKITGTAFTQTVFPKGIAAFLDALP
jgi:hypothetical protein